MRIDNMARKEATTEDPLELKSLRLDLVDRFSGKERERRFNALVQKIRSQHKRRDDG